MRFYTVFERTSRSRAAACCPGRDPFCAEDEEVLEALGRVHSGKVPACANLEKTKSVS